MKQAIAQGIDTLIITDPVHFLYFANLHITPYERFAALILDARSGNVHMILPGLEKGVHLDGRITPLFYEDHEGPDDRLRRILTDSLKLGVEKGVMPVAIAEKIENLSISPEGEREDRRFRDITPLILTQRLRKSEEEIAALEEAGRISDAILSRIQEFIRPGRTEKEIAMEILSAMAKEPGVEIEPFVIQILGGERGANPHGSAGSVPLQKGEAVTVDFGVCYRHYWSDCSRTFFIGNPPEILKRIYSIVLEAQEAAIQAVRPGIQVREVDAAARRVIESKGYGPGFIHRTGHGIGLGIHEDPSVHENNTILLEEGMVITVEPGIYLPNVGGVRIEDDVTVTTGGCRILTRYPKSFEKMILDMD